MCAWLEIRVFVLSRKETRSRELNINIIISIIAAMQLLWIIHRTGFDNYGEIIVDIVIRSIIFFLKTYFIGYSWGTIWNSWVFDSSQSTFTIFNLITRDFFFHELSDWRIFKWFSKKFFWNGRHLIEIISRNSITSSIRDQLASSFQIYERLLVVELKYSWDETVTVFLEEI